MDRVDFQTNLEAVREAFDQERCDFDSLMDELAVECTEEQWQDVLAVLEEERARLKQLANEADKRVESVPTFRPRQEYPVPGIVWVVTYMNYGFNEIVDVCETRAGAAGAADEHALWKHRLDRPTAKKAPWRDSWKKADAHCPCPEPGCDHEQWMRRLRGGSEYMILSWSTNDGKSRHATHDNLRSLRAVDTVDGGATSGDQRGAELPGTPADE